MRLQATYMVAGPIFDLDSLLIPPDLDRAVEQAPLLARDSPGRLRGIDVRDERGAFRGDVRCLLEQISDPAKYPHGVHAGPGPAGDGLDDAGAWSSY